MKRLKTFSKYILCIVLFFIFSRLLIFVGLNATYGNLGLKGTLPQGVTVNYAKATSVNGEVKGNVSEELNEKFVKFNFYTNADTLAGTYYVTPSELENGDFKFYFKMNFVDYFDVEITDEKPEIISSDEFSIEKYKPTLIMAALVGLLFL